MKLTAFVALILVVTTIAFSQSKNDQAIVEAVKVMDRQWIIEAYASKDLADFDRIVADDFMITGANGRVMDKAQKRANVKGDYSEDPSQGGVFKIDEASHNVRMIGSDLAISTGFIIENYTWKTQKINGHVHFTNVYLKRNGKWQAVQSHFTNIKQA